MKVRAFLLGAAALVSVLSPVAADAVTFNLIDTGGTAQGTAARRGFEIAAGYWSSVFTDNVTVNLQIGFASLAPNVLGSTGSARSLITMQQYYTATAADRTSALDNIAVANLQALSASTTTYRGGTTGGVSAIANNFANGVDATNGYTDLTTRIDNDGSTNNKTLAITKASAKALGLTTDVNANAINYATADANVTFSSNFAFDFDPTDGIDSQSFDFIGVAIHEIGHALGFVSGVDSYDSKTSPGQTAAASLTSTEGFVTMSQLDLYRYSSPGTLDWSTQNTPYFSIDGGQTQMFGNSLFSTGVLNGDGRQASHWKDSPAGAPQLGILDPTSARGQLQEVTALDLAAYDAIGWNIGFDVLANPTYRYSTAQLVNDTPGGVPEPSSWALMLLGFGGVGAALRRRKVAISFA